MSICMIHGYYQNDGTVPRDCPGCVTASMNQPPIVFHGPVFPCPQCARMKERLDREKMAKVLSDTAPWAASIKDFESWADELIKYLTE